MIVLLPNVRDGLTKMEEKLKTFDLNTLQSKMKMKKVNLLMPKFKLESTLDLKQPLTEVFTPNDGQF
jgi:serine protease inhibitor